MEPPIREASPVPPPPPPVLDGQLHLLDDFQGDDVSHYRRREAVWVSLAVHGVILALLIFLPKWSPSGPVIVSVQPSKDTTFLSLPPSPVTVKPPKTNIISDQNRVAQSRTPVPNKETLRKLIDAERPGPPKAVPPAQPQPAQQAAQAQAAPQAQQGAASMPAQPQDTAKLQVPPEPKKNPFAIASAGSSVEQAIRAAANNPVHSTTSFGSGHYGTGLRPKVDTAGNFDILSDTLGVDFGPYMRRLKVTVQDHWEPLIPESALPPMMKKGRVVVEFAIMKDGTIQGLRMVSSSGDVPLDRAAWGALISSIPVPRLPPEFSGDYLVIRASFFYNPDKGDFE